MSGARQAGATNLTQGSENFGYSAVRLRRIVKLQFGIVNPIEMVRYLLLREQMIMMMMMFSDFLTFFLLSRVIPFI